MKQLFLADTNLFALMVFVATFLALSLLFMHVFRQSLYRRQINKRLVPSDRFDRSIERLAESRRKRSLTADGDFALPFIWLNRLILQSGVSWGFQTIVLMTIVIAGAIFFIGSALKYNFYFTLALALFLGLLIPYLILRIYRANRLRKFEEQLPDAIDVLVRCLRAGHPVPMALHMVSREMPEPIGGEFKITSDELTYGLDLETAMSNLRTRVGQDDLSLVVIAVSMQTRTGGNLSEILSGLSKVIRNRFKLRRRVKSLSAEGRFSALFLTVLPIVLFGVIWFLAPNFYGDVWDNPLVKPILAGCVVWMVFGNYIIYRMVNFSI